MYSKSTTTKENIMLAVIKLLEHYDINEINISYIAKEADVAVGLINYHFKSKEKLFEMAIESYIVESIQKESIAITTFSLNPLEQLSASIKGYADFLARNRKIYRYFLLNHLAGNKESESTYLGYLYYMPILKEIKKDCEETDLIILIYQIVNSIQVTFLKNEILKDKTKLDFFCQEDREQLVDKLICNLL